MHFSAYAAMNYNNAISLIDQALSEDVDALIKTVTESDPNKKRVMLLKCSHLDMRVMVT